MAELSPIACETCRQKKRGCDRSLPHCLQCSKTPSQCIYPEVNKRGLPLGYLTKVEERLAETEAALFAALSVLIDRGQLPDSVAEHLVASSSSSSRHSKAERTQEWERLPLRTGDDLAGWYNSRALSPDDRREDAGELGLPRRCTPQDPELNLRSSRLTSGDSDAPERSSTYVASPEHGARAETAGSGMAEALTKSKKHLYF